MQSDVLGYLSRKPIPIQNSNAEYMQLSSMWVDLSKRSAKLSRVSRFFTWCVFLTIITDTYKANVRSTIKS